MNIVHKVTLRLLKENKRRTLVTIIGVIISVAMITAVSTISVSFLDLVIRQHIANNGEWHVEYKDVSLEQITAIKQDDNTKTLMLSSSSYAVLEESENDYKPYLYFQNYNKEGLENFPIEVIEGRMPERSDEIAISEPMISNAKTNFNIGERISIPVGKRINKTDGTVLNQTDPIVWDENIINEEIQVAETRTLTVVGIVERPEWEPAWSPGYTVIGYVDEQNLSNAVPTDAMVVLNDLNGSLFDDAKNLADALGIEKINFNSELLRYYGITANDNLRSTLYSLASIIMAVIIIGSVALIYNAFAISVSERARHLGMLSSVGATKKQKRNSVFFEGAVVGFISIPIGILAGIAGIGITFAYINQFLHGALGVTEKLELVVTPASILLAIGISIVTIFISTYVPAQRASKISAIDAIRQTHDIKLSGKKVKTSKFVRKVFGMEAEIGLKNVKRNKKRYLATLFSLVISIVLFLSVSFFTENLKKSLILSQDNIQYDLQIYSNGLNKNELNKFANLDHVTSSTLIEEIQLEALIEMEALPDLLKQQITENNIPLQDGKYPYFVSLHSLDQESFRSFAKQIGVNPEDFMQSGNPAAIVIDQISYKDYDSGKIIETKAIETEVGNKLDLYAIFYEDAESEEAHRQFVTSLHVGALTDQVPPGVYSASLGGVNLIVPDAIFAQLPIEQEYVNTYLYLNSTDPMATQAAIEKWQEPSLHIYNVEQHRQRGEQMIMIMSVFAYGFITLITLISIANIFNTISTSISLRKREFAMLRSVGMTPKGFHKMIRYESLFYGIKALAYGLPISILVMFLIYRAIGHTFEYQFQLPWLSILTVIVMIFFIVGTAMLYSIAKIKNENIIDALRQENI